MPPEPRAVRGRPRAFNEAEVLDQAIALFSAGGFAAVSIADLVAVTGLSAGSLYKAYRDKEGIFAGALDRYIAERDRRLGDIAAGAPGGRARITALLRLYAGLSQGEAGQRGCLVVSGITGLDQLGATAAVLRATLARRHAMLAALVAEGQRDGSIATTEPPEGVADLLLALLQGMRVVGKGGRFPEDGEGFVRRALRLLD
ncbi:TetR family transcriptional regulator [Pseudoroseomonas deserti]|uniref:TetR family transcriptional regulator n=1 Tax=Teichococcus deserti TaxID=1817963 RepID=A0A1V2H1Z7_9PROT|nr:TetR/AcrR family transcriptional regulator [Pseudoroseomonas deserti]ONG53328.1 TetR family transcriptional regulator [Pseudoroseomonas deserti]